MILARPQILGLAAAILFGASSSAPAFPDRAVEYILPFQPGGESDIAAKLQQPVYQKKFGQDLTLSYRPGKGGASAWADLNSLKPDGYTIMGVNLPHIVLQPAKRDAGYKTAAIQTVYWFHYSPSAIVVKADSPLKSLDDLLNYAKNNPGKLTFSGSGRGTANHLAKIQFDNMAEITTLYVPFKGTGASNTALLGGQVAAAWGYTTSAAALGDKSRILAVAMEERHPNYPDAPTFRELGYDFVSGAYRGIAVPQGTPRRIQQKLSQMIGDINADPAFRQQMRNAGFVPVDIPLEKAASFLKQKSREFIDAAERGGYLETLPSR